MRRRTGRGSQVARGFDALRHLVSSGADVALRIYRPVFRFTVDAAVRVGRAAAGAVGHAVRDVSSVVSDAAAWGAHAAAAVYHQAASAGTRAYHAVAHWAQAAYHASAHVVGTSFHAVARAATATASFIKHHAAAIASFVVSTVVFVGCEAVLTGASGGALTVPGAIVCGAPPATCSGTRPPASGLSPPEPPLSSSTTATVPEASGIESTLRKRWT